MYLRATTRKKDGKVHRYWQLVESVRIGRRVIQRTVAQLGELDGEGKLKARALARHLISAPEQATLFDDGHEHVTVPVRLKGIRIERARQFGDVYPALVRAPAHDGQDSGMMADSIPAAWRTVFWSHAGQFGPPSGMVSGMLGTLFA